jgi:hypothetical protein
MKNQITRKNFIISKNNENNLKNLKKVTEIERGNPVSEAKIINVALSQFFENKQKTELESEYTEQLEVLKCYNLI